MFASDSDIKDIAEAIETSDSPVSKKTNSSGSRESITTLKVVGSSSEAGTATNTPSKKDLNLEESESINDINANPRLAHSTPLREGKSSSASPLSEMDVSNPMLVSTSTGCSSGASSVQLSQLYQEICEQKDVIMSCLDEDNCDIDQVKRSSSSYPPLINTKYFQLNAEIAKLQSQQHKYSMMEFESNKTMWLSQVTQTKCNMFRY